MWIQYSPVTIRRDSRWKADAQRGLVYLYLTIGYETRFRFWHGQMDVLHT